MPRKRISHYQIVRKIGAGGMGEVFLAQDTRLGRAVALKVMSAELAKDATQRKRFRAEAKAASGLNHPNICAIHEVSETEDGRPFLAMEYVEGQTLNLIMQQRRLRIREILGIGIQVAEALTAAHARCIVHRDIKPSNIMVDQHGQTRLLDFGLAKRVSNDGVTPMTTPLTNPGSVLGTPHYMSPEQLLGGELDQRSDLFSLGVIFYEMVVGQRPFLGNTIVEVMNAVINRPAEPLGLENPIASPELEAIIFKCLEKDRKRRYPTAEALAQDLIRLRRALEQVGQAPVGDILAHSAVSTSTAPLPKRVPPKRDRRFSVPAAGLAAVMAIAAILIWALRPGPHVRELAARQGTGSSGGTFGKSVAVLPFDNYSAEKETDYLSDGLTEEITTALARVPGLHVVARNSAFAFKTRREDLRDVGSKLGVATILEGSLGKVGNRIHVSARLINAADGLHLWAETYDRGVEDILAVEEDIARKIAAKFALSPGNEAANFPAHRSAPNTQAYVLYLKGLFFWNKRTQDDLEQAAKLFNQAIEKDPTYGAAYAGLASTYICLPDYSARPHKEYLPLARAAAEKALTFDATSADAHTVQGMVNRELKQYKAAEEELRRATELNPNHATAHDWYGILLNDWGRKDEALLEWRRAEVLDPLSPIIKLHLLFYEARTRQYEHALAACEKNIQLFPDFVMFHSARAWLLERLGCYPEALAEALSARSTMTNSPFQLGLLGLIYARSGDIANARKILDELEESKRRGHTVRKDIALVHVALHEYDRALDEYEAAYAESAVLTDLRDDPQLDDLRSYPRFQALLAKIASKQ